MSTVPAMGQHAIVIGASVAGLCAARVLSDHYDRVTIYERDELPDAPVNRSAVPQGRHVHLLMARGAAEFDGLFPGLLDDMVAAGVPMLGEPARLHPFRRRGPRVWERRTLRDEFTAYVPVGRTSSGRSAVVRWPSPTSTSSGGVSPNPGSTLRRSA